MKQLILTTMMALVAALPIAAQGPAKPASIGGPWRVVIESPHGTIEAALVLKQDGGKLTGTYDGEEIVTGTVTGNDVLIAIAMTGMTFEMKGAVKDADTMAGQTVTGSFPWTATRKK